MITHLHIEFLDPGALPMFDKDEGQMVWYLGNVTPSTEGTWEARQAGNRMMINTTIDIALADLGGRLRAKLPELPDDADGSLVFCIQAAYNLNRIADITIDTSSATTTVDTSSATNTEGAITITTSGTATGAITISAAYPLLNPDDDPPLEATGTWVLGGLAFMPGVEKGVRLGQDDDAVAIIEQGCRAFMEPVTADLHDAVAAGAIRFHDPANTRHEFPMGEPMTDEAILEAIGRRRERKARINMVETKARKLLMACLTPYQRFEFLEYGEFHVTGLDGYTYVIREQFGHNVFRIEDGDQTWEYCLVTEHWGVPKFDLMLAQKLLLEREPEAFFEKANAWRLML